MRLTMVFAALTAAGLLAAPAQAQQSSTTRVYSNRDQTVVVSRDENGRRRTKIIVQKRSYLDPGTEPLPVERNTLDYVQIPGQRTDFAQKNTMFYSDRANLFDPFDLPSTRNPWVDYQAGR
jgi:hypothetical protein